MSNKHPVPRKSSPEGLAHPHKGYKDKEKRKKWLEKYNSKPENRIRKREYDVARRLKPGVKEKAWEQFLKNEYGISVDEYNALYERQKGRCAICELNPPHYRKGKLCLDHNHQTGKIRGLLCDRCNRGIGLLQDDVKNLERAVKYLYAE